MQILFALGDIDMQALSVSDFKLIRAVCELRYEDAFLIYDRTGEVAQSIRRSFKDLKANTAAPIQTVFQCKEGTLALELNACRFSAERPDLGLEEFAANCEAFFSTVTETLDIKVFTRIGLRLIFRSKTSDLAQAKAALKALNLVNVGSRLWFGAATDPEEVMFRWQNDEIGATIRLKADTGKIDVTFPAEVEDIEPSIHQTYTGILLDIDYYAAAPVERSQWSATAWIPPSGRRIRKETDQLLGR